MRVVNTSGQEHSGIYCAYVRVSTDDQDVERQKLEIKNWLNGGDHQVIWFEEEGISGKIAPEKRPKLAECINTAKASKGSIIVADLDRFSRTQWHTLKFFEEVLDKGKIKLIVCNDPSISESFERFSMKVMFAEFERKKISERTKSGLARIKNELKRRASTRVGKVVRSPSWVSMTIWIKQEQELVKWSKLNPMALLRSLHLPYLPYKKVV